jgi:hypothetical protein
LEAAPTAKIDSQAEPALSEGHPGLLATARIWALHLICFVLPVTTLAFAATGRTAGGVSLLFVLPSSRRSSPTS